MPKKELVNNDAVTLRVAEPVGDILDDTMDVIEKTVDTIENTTREIVEVTKNNPLVLVGVAVVALGVGGYLGYRFGVKRTTLKYETIMEEQIEAAKEYYTRLNKAEEYSTPEKAVGALIPEKGEGSVPPKVGKVLRDYRGEGEKSRKATPAPARPVVQEKVTVERNVFTDEAVDPNEWNYELEVADREVNPDRPYVISLDEWTESIPGQDRSNLSYYAGDDVLVDEKDMPIDNTEYIVGDDNLLRFGHGSGDPQTVFVRNEAISTDFEITRSDGTYSEEVLGHKPEIRHSQSRSRMRWGADE